MPGWKPVNELGARIRQIVANFILSLNTQMFVQEILGGDSGSSGLQKLLSALMVFFSKEPDAFATSLRLRWERVQLIWGEASAQVPAELLSRW